MRSVLLQNHSIQQTKFQVGTLRSLRMCVCVFVLLRCATTTEPNSLKFYLEGDRLYARFTQGLFLNPEKSTSWPRHCVRCPIFNSYRSHESPHV